MSRRTITINGRQVPVYDDELTGDDVKALAGIAEDDRDKRQVVVQQPDRNVLVPDHDAIRVVPDAVFTHHARHSKAAVTATVRSRRLQRELAVVRRLFPQAEAASDLSWVLIPDYTLPHGWEPSLTTILIVPPPNYPEAGPDGFYLGDRLRRHGRTPGHYFRAYRKNRFADRGYVWYCLEDPERNWQPEHDSLVTFLDAIWTYLGSVPD